MTPAIKQIILNVCEATGVSYDQIRSPARVSGVVDARSLLTHELKKYALRNDIVADIINRKRCSVNHLLTVYENEFQTNPMFREIVAKYASLRNTAMQEFNETWQRKRKGVTYIGIDPDKDKNGVALYRSDTEVLERLLALTFFELFDYLKMLKETEPALSVVIEAGWQNNGNWHTKRTDSAAKAAKIGKYVGGNHEVGQKIVEMCEYLHIQYRLVTPKRRKTNAEEFTRITKWVGRTNQEQRDAALLVFGL